MTGAIILAAGSSSRMGTSKQMLDIEGEKLLIRTIKAAQGAQIDPVIVVLGANHEQHAGMLENANVSIAYNGDWRNGIGTSIRAGVQSLLSAYHDVASLLILVCDQPLLTSDVLSEIIRRHHETKKPIVASSYAVATGVPVLFDKIYFERLTALPDDQGAKMLIFQNATDTALVSFPGGAIDLDTMEEYDAFMKAGSGGTNKKPFSFPNGLSL